MDVSLQDVPEGEVPLHRAGPNPETASLEHIEIAAGMIFRSQNPVILVGSDAVRENASEALTEMAETLHIPVVNTMMAKGMIPYTSPYSLWDGRHSSEGLCQPRAGKCRSAHLRGL